MNCGKFLKRWEYQTTLSTSCKTSIQIKKQQLKLDMKQRTGSKLGKEYNKAVYCHLAYLTYIRSESESEVAQSCPTLCDPLDCRLPGSSLHEILQARVLEWVAISFSRGSSWTRDGTQVSWIPGRRFNLWATREAPGSIEEYIHLNFRAITSSLPQRHHGMRVSVSFLSHGIKLT